MRKTLVVAAALIALPSIASAQEVRFGGLRQANSATSCSVRLALWADVKGEQVTISWRTANAKERFSKSETRAVRLMDGGGSAYPYVWTVDLEQKSFTMKSDRCTWIGYWDGRPEVSAGGQGSN